MGLARFTVETSPGDLTVTVNDAPVPATRVILDATPGQVPTLTVQATGPGTITGEGVVQVVRDPAPGELDDAAVDLIARVNVEEYATRCQAKVRAGRNDPWRVALETLVEMARG